MKKILLLCWLVIGLAAAGNAQNHRGTADPKEKAMLLQKQLKLTRAQTEKISAIYRESSEKFEKIKMKEHGNNDKMMISMRPLRKETIAKIKAVLKPRQAAEYDKMVREDSPANNNGWSDGWSPMSK